MRKAYKDLLSSILNSKQRRQRNRIGVDLHSASFNGKLYCFVLTLTQRYNTQNYKMSSLSLFHSSFSSTLQSTRRRLFFWLSLSDCRTVAAFLVSSRLGRSVVVRPLLAISIGVSLFPLSLSIFMRPSSALFDINIVVPAADRWHRYRPSVVAIRPPCRPLFVWPPQSGCSGRSQAIPALQLLSGHSLGYPTTATALWPLWSLRRLFVHSGHFVYSVCISSAFFIAFSIFVLSFPSGSVVCRLSGHMWIEMHSLIFGRYGL